MARVRSTSTSAASKTWDQLPGVAIERLAFLQAWDPVAGKEVWRVTLDSEYSGSGVLSTAGNLVFQGSGDGFLYIYASETGARLASIHVGTSMMAAPVSYAVDGEQYVAIMAGYGGPPGWNFPKVSAAPGTDPGLRSPHLAPGSRRCSPFAFG
jgi:quinohemoprotein ethanol dehydrogenase